MFKSIDTSQNGGFDSITFGNNKKGKVKGLGKIAISNDMSISNVLLVESLDFNLLSIAQLCDLGFKCIFGSDDVEVVSERIKMPKRGGELGFSKKIKQPISSNSTPCA